MLYDLGLPVPEQELVYSEREALGAAHHIGFPVVVKPLDANHGRGVSINLNSDVEVRRAFAVARSHVASYKLPRRFVFVDEIQRSPSGKADYRWAKARALEGG